VNGPNTPAVAQAATGAVQAQLLIDDLRAERCGADAAWLRLTELAATYGHLSTACAAFVHELCKRAAS
jgi:hypothetical protein